MNKFLVRLALAAAVTLGVTVLGASANAQEPQSSQEPAATAPPQQQEPAATPQQQQEPTANAPEQNNAQSNEMQTQDAKSFTGQVMKEDGKIVLKDPVTKMSYQLDDQDKAGAFVGKQVKVTGKLDTSSNTIHVDSIELMS